MERTMAGAGETTGAVVDPGAAINTEVDGSGDAAVHEAAERGNCAGWMRRVLATPGVDVNLRGSKGETALCKASHLGHYEVVSLLLGAPGIDVNKADKGGQTPLWWASYNGHTEAVNVLLGAPGIDVNLADRGGWTPLHWASHNGHSEFVSLLLRAPGIDVNLVNENWWESNGWEGNGWAPLHCASSRGCSEAVSLLLAVPGLRVLQKNKAGKSAMELAVHDSDVWHMLNEVVHVKQTFGALLRAGAYHGVSRDGAEDLAMRGLRDDRAREMAKRLRDTWPLRRGGAPPPPGAGGGDGEGEKEGKMRRTTP